MLLAGDIGGTKTVLAVITPEGGPRQPLVEETFPSARYPTLEALVRAFLQRVNLPIERACFGVAGPVVDGRCQVTNLPWVIDEARLQQSLRLETVHLLNDLEAVAYSLPLLDPADLYTINAGAPVRHGALAVVAPGTGLGEAFAVSDGRGYRAYPSEGGHASFAPANQVESELLRYLQKRLEHVSCERVCSGRGIPNIYAFLKESGRGEEPEWLTERLAATNDPTPIIVQAALEESCDLCVATLDVFVSILGGEAGNLALKVLATGGVYLGGGIPPRILPVLERGGLLEAFSRKGRFAGTLARVPIHVILNPQAPLIGTAQYVLEQPAG